MVNSTRKLSLVSRRILGIREDELAPEVPPAQWGVRMNNVPVFMGPNLHWVDVTRAFRFDSPELAQSYADNMGYSDVVTVEAL